jgi:hypothetical protein
MEKRLVNFSGLIMIPVMLFLSACSTHLMGSYGAKGQTMEEFTHYVEGVFRLQNSMTSEIMELQENDELNNRDVLLKSEQTMQETCAPLNEYVSLETEGLSTDVSLLKRVEKTAVDCEQAALKVKTLLKQ